MSAFSHKRTLSVSVVRPLDRQTRLLSAPVPVARLSAYRSHQPEIALAGPRMHNGLLDS